jgi:hypothetical protein
MRNFQCSESNGSLPEVRRTLSYMTIELALLAAGIVLGRPSLDDVRRAPKRPSEDQCGGASCKGGGTDLRAGAAAG